MTVSDGLGAPATAELAGELTATERINLAYDLLGLDEQLEAYAFRNSDRFGWDGVIKHSLAQYGQAIAREVEPAGQDIPLIRAAFDQLYDSMERIADMKHGPVPVRRSTLGELALIKFGLHERERRNHFSRLDDRYWDNQFMEEYKEETWVKRREGESEQEYLGRYIGSCLYHFPWAYFSYI